MTTLDQSHVQAPTRALATPDPGVRRGSTGQLGQLVGIVLSPLFTLAVLLGIWQAASVLELVPPDLLPSPTRIATAGFAVRGTLWTHVFPTLIATLIGFPLSVTVAFCTATLLDFSSGLRRAVLPLLIVSQTLPLIALAPLVVLWFGFGMLPKILLVAFVTFFPMTIGFMRGFNTADPEAEHLLRSMGASRTKIFRMIRLPAATSSFFSALRISITHAVTGAIFAEYVGAVAGLGVYMQNAKNIFRTDLVLATVVVTSLLTLTLYAVAVLIEKLVAPWLKFEQGES